MVLLAGIEPASADYKSAALPLSENGMKKAPSPGGKDACMIQFFLRTSDFSHSFKSENVLKRMETVMTSAAKVQQYAKK